MYVVYVVKEAASFRGVWSNNGRAWDIIECALKLYRPAGRKLLVAYIETGTNSCSCNIFLTFYKIL